MLALVGTDVIKVYTRKRQLPGPMFFPGSPKIKMWSL